MKGIFMIILAVLVPLWLFSSVLYVVIVSDGFYENEFEKEGVRERVGTNEVEEVHTQVMSFLKEGVPLTTSLLTEKEKAHMGDVRGLLKVLKSVVYSVWIVLLLSVVALVVQRKWGVVLRASVLGGVFTLILIGIFGLLVLVDFSWVFEIFHRVVFENELWRLSPEDYLIRVYGGDFFEDLVMLVLVWSGVLAVLLSGVCWSVQKQLKRKLIKNA